MLALIDLGSRQVSGFKRVWSDGRPRPSIRREPNESLTRPRHHVPYPASLAANTSTTMPITIRYTANGAKPRFRTHAINQATLA